MTTRDLAIRALAEEFQFRHPDIPLTSADPRKFSDNRDHVWRLAKNPSPYVGRLEDNLLPDVIREHFEQDLRDGNGGELKWWGKGKRYKPKFWALYSSSALAVNAFALFKKEQSEISMALPTEAAFTQFRFEEKHRAWDSNPPANLDLVATGDGHVMGVESKMTEHIPSKKRLFEDHHREAYKKNIQDARRDGAWFSAIDAGPYRHLDFAQLVKHALALSHDFQEDDVTLLYLYWEPENWQQFDEFKNHRDEIDHFSDLVRGDTPRFQSMSYSELWEQWKQHPQQPDWLPKHVRNLRKRYDVSLQSKKQN